MLHTPEHADRTNPFSGIVQAPYSVFSPVDVGPFHLQCKIGQGGMGVIFGAVHCRLSLPVAVKVITREGADHPRFRQALVNEMQADKDKLARLMQDTVDLAAKAFGCFRHQVLQPASPYLRGFSDDFIIPVSRWTEMRQPEIDAVPGLVTLLGSDDVGPCLVEDRAHRALYIFNHFEYDSDTLKQEYDRDVTQGTPINVPMNYYPQNDPSRAPQNRWRSHAHLLYSN